jgi:hypothetical protein
MTHRKSSFLPWSPFLDWNALGMQLECMWHQGHDKIMSATSLTLLVWLWCTLLHTADNPSPFFTHPASLERTRTGQACPGRHPLWQTLAPELLASCNLAITPSSQSRIDLDHAPILVFFPLDGIEPVLLSDQTSNTWQAALVRSHP